MMVVVVLVEKLMVKKSTIIFGVQSIASPRAQYTAWQAGCLSRRQAALCDTPTFAWHFANSRPSPKGGEKHKDGLRPSVLHAVISRFPSLSGQ